MACKNWLVISLFCLVNLSLGAQTNYLFKNRKEGYRVYRIPALVSTAKGKLLAFCEGRNNLFDGGDIDIVMKTSTDSGKTWSALQVVWNDGNNTCGNPSPVVDAVTGDVLLVATFNNDKVVVLRSKNEGVTWEIPVDITTAVKPENWKWYATGPVHAIQMVNSSYKGRIVVPCNHTTVDNNKHVSHSIYSDDSGFTWQLGGSAPQEKTDECTVVELQDGRLLLNMRGTGKPIANRKRCYSTNGGLTWSEVEYDSTLIEPVCQGALLNYANAGAILFSNPHHTKQRKNLSMHISYDNAGTWSKKLLIHKGKSAYNDLAILPNGNVLCIFETGKILPYSGIALVTIRKDRLVR